MDTGKSGSSDNYYENGINEQTEVTVKRLAYIVEFMTEAKNIIPRIRDLVKKMSSRGVSLTTIVTGSEACLGAKLRHDTRDKCDVLFETRPNNGLSLLVYTHCNKQTLKCIMGKVRSESESLTGTPWPDDPSRSFMFTIKERESNKFQQSQESPFEDCNDKTKEHSISFPDALFLDFDSIHDKWVVEMTPKRTRGDNARSNSLFCFYKLEIHSLLIKKALHIDDIGHIEVCDEHNDHNCGVFETSNEQLVLNTTLAPAYSRQMQTSLRKAIAIVYPLSTPVLSIKLRLITDKI
jgi:hypothetical protein